MLEFWFRVELLVQFLFKCSLLGWTYRFASRAEARTTYVASPKVMHGKNAGANSSKEPITNSALKITFEANASWVRPVLAILTPRPTVEGILGEGTDLIFNVSGAEVVSLRYSEC